MALRFYLEPAGPAPLPGPFPEGEGEENQTAGRELEPQPPRQSNLAAELHRLLFCAKLAPLATTIASGEHSAMVTIRLSRGGSKKRPFYSILVADQRRPARGRFIERVGFYNPIAVGREVKLRIDTDQVDHWVSLGAQPSKRVRQLYQQAKSASKVSPVKEEKPEAPDAPDHPAQPAKAVEAAESSSSDAAERADSAESTDPVESEPATPA